MPDQFETEESSLDLAALQEALAAESAAAVAGVQVGDIVDYQPPLGNLSKKAKVLIVWSEDCADLLLVDTSDGCDGVISSAFRGFAAGQWMRPEAP